RPARSASPAGGRILRPQSHRRTHVPRHQRSQQRSHGPRPRHHVHRSNACDHDPRRHHHGPPFSVADPLGAVCPAPLYPPPPATLAKSSTISTNQFKPRSPHSPPKSRKISPAFASSAPM